MGIYRFAATAVALLAAAWSVQAADIPRFTIERIEAPTAYQPLRMNALGDMVGHKLVYVDDFEEYRRRDAYRQFAGSGPQPMPDAPGGPRYSSLVAINDSGLAVGFVSVERVRVNQDYKTSGQRVEVVRRDGTKIDLVSLLPEGADSFAVDVNNLGEVAGNIILWSSNGSGASYAKPFVWSESAGMRFPLGNGMDGPSVRASAINDAGQLVGIGDSSSNDGLIFVWEADRGWRYSRRPVESVIAMNNLGQVVGRDVFRRAYVWTVRDGKIGLPRFDDQPNAYCEAVDINDAGVIIGYCNRSAMWIPGDNGQYRVVDLWDQVTFPPDTPLWRQKQYRPRPVRIENDGRVLVGDRIDFFDPDYSSILMPIP